jgi:hypothetical protein
VTLSRVFETAAVFAFLASAAQADPKDRPHRHDGDRHKVKDSRVVGRKGEDSRVVGNDAPATVPVSVVPEPGTLTLVGLGGSALFVRALRRRRGK